MKSSIWFGAALAGTLALGIAAAPSLVAQSQGTATQTGPRNPTRAEVVQMMKDISNWGRWGKDDEIGTFNLITPAGAQGRGGAGQGRPRRCRWPTPSTRRCSPTTRRPSSRSSSWARTARCATGAAMDVISSTYHATTTTHMDSLCHYIFEGKTYNGWEIEKYHQATPTREGFGEGPGCMKNSILGFKNGLMTRGVLIDLPLMKGVKWLEPGTPVTIADLEAWEKFAGIRIGSGDALFLRTGRFARRAGTRPVALGARVGRLPRVGDAVVQAARRGAHQQRLGAGRAAVEHRGLPAADSHAGDQLAGHADDRRRRSRGSRAGRRPAETLGVHADRDGPARPGRIGIAGEPDRDVLTRHEVTSALFRAQRLQRIHSRRAQRRDGARRHADGQQRRAHRRIGPRDRPASLRRARLPIRRVRPRAQTKPTTRPTAASAEALPQHHADHLPAIGANRQADADLVRAPRHQIRRARRRCRPRPASARSRRTCRAGTR